MSFDYDAWLDREMNEYLNRVIVDDDFDAESLIESYEASFDAESYADQMEDALIDRFMP